MIGSSQIRVDAALCDGCKRWLPARELTGGRFDEYPVFAWALGFQGAVLHDTTDCNGLVALYQNQYPIQLRKEQLS